jgi:penicillin-binding protein 1C
MFNSGMLLPDMLIPDIPTQIAGFSPQNYDATYDGAVSVSSALARSLNIPAVLLLQKYGVNNFYEDLKFYGQRNVNRHPSNYGLSLILGGAESSLWDLCGTYASYASTLRFYNENQQRYRKMEFQELVLTPNKELNFGNIQLMPTKVDASSIYLTFKAMLEVNRVVDDEAWKYYSSASKISWKTGTSFGNRDAWAIGVNSKYVVGVWVGNASGEGRPNLTGVGTASPILFDVFNLLPKNNWFKRPEQGMSYSSICEKSGHLASVNCSAVNKWINKRGEETEVCSYCIPVFLDKNSGNRVNANCAKREEMIKTSWFVLPPIMAFYYRRKSPCYETLPPFKEGCSEDLSSSRVQFIYPQNNAVLYLTRDNNGKYQSLVLKAAVANRNSEVFWYLKRTFIGSTHAIHEMNITPKTGKHIITIIDEFGNEESVSIDVVSN